MRKKRTNWTEQKIAVLIQLYPIETTPRTAEILGMCERAVKEKARCLGLKKAVKNRWMEHADYVRNHFAHRSYAEIGKVSNRARVRLRSWLKSKGYIAGEEYGILYYTDDLHRIQESELRGAKLGFRFLPYPSEETIVLSNIL